MLWVCGFTTPSLYRKTCWRCCCLLHPSPPIISHYYCLVLSVPTSTTFKTTTLAVVVVVICLFLGGSAPITPSLADCTVDREEMAWTQLEMGPGKGVYNSVLLVLPYRVFSYLITHSEFFFHEFIHLLYELPSVFNIRNILLQGVPQLNYTLGEESPPLVCFGLAISGFL